MSFKVKLSRQGYSEEFHVEEGSSLFACIRDHVEAFVAPCGGNGVCGKCRVNILNEGYVTACLYNVHKDIEVVLPEALEMRVLSEQYKRTKTLMPNAGNAMELATIPYGLAVDIGTTTMVFYVVNLLFGTVVDISSTVNPQSKYGADVISRIQYGAEVDDGVRNLREALIEPINDAIRAYCERNEIAESDFVRISIVGNTTMLHQLMGVDAIGIAHAPFVPTFVDTKKMKAQEFGIGIHEEGELILAPSLSAYVGADIIAGLASVDTIHLKKNYLFIDIGTNGEMILVTPEKILACATAAGPAFEGANISCGMSAMQGAISSFSPEGYSVIGNVEPVGICGSGLIDIVASMLNDGSVNSDGNISEDKVLYHSGKNKVVITQQDIREVQLAKSAVAAGINRMLAMAGISKEELDHVLLAGGFGNYLQIESAIRIGLLPDIDLDKYIQIGNSAGSGAVLTLKSDDFISQMEALRDRIDYIELSTDPEFTMEYAMGMFFISS